MAAFSENHHLTEYDSGPGAADELRRMRAAILQKFARRPGMLARGPWRRVRRRTPLPG